MSYQTRFFAEFIDAPTKNADVPYTNQLVLVRFMLDGYDGPADEISVYAEDGLRTKKNGSDSLFEPINAKSVSIRLRTESVELARGLFSNNDRQWRVEILRRDDTSSADYRLDFAGWLVPTYTQFDYKKPPFALNLTASCGLAGLKDRPLLDANGKRLSGSESLSTVVRTALALTGHDLDLLSAVNLYELSDMAVGATVTGPNGKQTADPARDPLRRTLLNTLSFISESKETVMAYDALKTVLETFPGARISQRGGQWVIVRGPEAGGGWDPQNIANDTVRARLYPAGSAMNTAPVSNQSINLNTTVYPGNAVRAKTGGSTGMTPQKNGVLVEQKFGQLISKFPNGDLSQADNTGLPFGWDRFIFSPREAQRIGNGSELSPYQIKILGAGSNKDAINKQSIGVRIQFPTGIKEFLPEFKRSKKWTLKGRYQLYKARAMQTTIFCKRADGIRLATQSGEWKLFPEQKDNVTIRFDNSYSNGKVYNPTPTDFSITLHEIDRVTDLWIRFNDPEDLDKTDGTPGGQKNPDAYVLIWNLSLTVELDGLNLTGQSLSTSRENTKAPEPSLTLTYGDYPSDADTALNRTGTLITRSTGSPTALWLHPSDGERLNGKPLLQHHLQVRANQVMQAVDSWQGKIIGPLPHGLHTVLRFADIGDPDPNFGFIVPWPFVITALETDERKLEHTITAVRMMPDIALLGKKSNWQTPNGDILQSYDETTGSVAPPIDPITLPFPGFDKLLPILKTVFPDGLRNNNTIQTFPNLIYTGPRYSNATLVIDNGMGQVVTSNVTYYRPKPYYPSIDEIPVSVMSTSNESLIDPE